MADDQQHDDDPMIYRFYPTEEELISFYLSNQLENRRPHDLHRVIPVVNVYQHNHPSHLPKLAGELCRGDTEQWFFFVPRQEREAQGGRPSRTTASGYWKATGSPTYVYSSENKVIGVKKTMVFYEGKYSRTVKKTVWKMNEYRAIKQDHDHVVEDNTPAPKLRQELSVCRVYVVSGTTRAFDRRPIGIDSMEMVNPPEAIRKQAGASSSSSSSRNIPVQILMHKPGSTSAAASSYLQSLCPSPDDDHDQIMVDDHMVEDYMPPPPPQPQPQHQWEHYI